MLREMSVETGIRLSAFGAALVLLVLAELAWPRRRAAPARRRRWPTNLGLMALGAIAVRLAGPLTAAEVGALATERRWGLLGAAGIATSPAGVVAAVIALDLAVYGQHVLMHRVPFLWRLHRVHHADPVFDTTTGVRFHPLETLLSAGLKLGLVAGLGASAGAVIAFEVLLNVSALFNHANLRLPIGLDALLRRALVTPDMHRVHHSADAREQNRNFGFALPWWDRLGGTYQDQPPAGHEGMTIGLRSVPTTRAASFGAMLVDPFRTASPAPTEPDGKRRRVPPPPAGRG